MCLISGCQRRPQQKKHSKKRGKGKERRSFEGKTLPDEDYAPRRMTLQHPERGRKIEDAGIKTGEERGGGFVRKRKVVNS